MKVEDTPPQRPAASRGAILSATLMIAVVIVGLLVSLGVFSGGDGDISQTPDGVKGVEETAKIFRGIEQEGVRLGRADAPVTITVFADLKCPHCRTHFREVEPKVIERVVRTGKANIELRLLALPGFLPDNEAGRAAAHRVAAENRMYDFVQLMFYNQGNASQQWISPQFLQQMQAEVPGRKGRAFDLTPNDASRALDKQADAARDRLDVKGTPAVYVSARGSANARKVQLGGVFKDGADQIVDAVNEVSGK